MSRSLVTISTISRAGVTKWYVRDLGLVVAQGEAPTQAIARTRADAAKQHYIAGAVRPAVAGTHQPLVGDSE